jgi:hypothetical protein
VTLDTLLLDETAYRVGPRGAREVRFSPRHEALLDELYRTLGEDGPLRFSD